MQSRAVRIMEMVLIQNKNISDIQKYETIKATTSHALDITKNNSTKQQQKLKSVEKNLEVENEVPPIKPQNVNCEETRTDIEYANDKEDNEKNKEDVNCIFKSKNNSEDGKVKLISDETRSTRNSQIKNEDPTIRMLINETQKTNGAKKNNRKKHVTKNENDNTALKRKLKGYKVHDTENNQAKDKDKAFELDQVDNEQMKIKGNNIYENGQFSEDSEFDSNFSSESEYIPSTTSASESENENYSSEASTRNERVKIPLLPEGHKGKFIITLGFYLQ